MQKENLKRTQAEFQKKNHSNFEGHEYLMEAEGAISSLN
ncbi:MAG: hypothetical protein ACI8Z7_000604 [Candidatus Nanohaloarchaea archaeon]|jgi:hypothetical protein